MIRDIATIEARMDSIDAEIKRRNILLKYQEKRIDVIELEYESLIGERCDAQLEALNRQRTARQFP